MNKNIEPSRLKLFFAVCFGATAIFLFIYSLFVAQIDAQGAIVIIMVLPILSGLIIVAHYLARGSKVVRRALVLAVTFPIGLLYVSFFVRPLNFILESVMKTISQEFVRQTGITPFDWGKGTRAIHIAARKGDILKIEAEIKKGVSVDLKNVYDETPLYFCAESKQLEACKTLIGLGANPSQQKNSQWTALHIASDYGFLEMVKLLVEAKADVNLKNMQGQTALQLAKEKNHSEVIAYLKAHGAIE